MIIVEKIPLQSVQSGAHPLCFFLLQNELVFKPSIGVEFVTKMGVNVPEFVESTVEMHTSMYHESALQAKITMENNEVKLSIPAPEVNTRIFSMW